ncbi:hypothetical protein Asd1617_03120 [Shigella dysenteriae 1617]|uniref:Uncharacterized protein n=1 Tax=Shigella dysenteriae 1617 TaxID=754093 RepID=A0A0A6ZVI7_SHIDY|nr:hypothetical protein Asd1617_03120 [Shigella dysenteriae 1617]
MFKYEHMFKSSLQYLYPCGLTGLVIFYRVWRFNARLTGLISVSELKNN